MVFWKTTDQSEKLKSIYQIYSDSLVHKKIKIVAINLDEAISTNLIQPYVKSNDLQMDVYIDVNGDFK
jgi:hypothetical protein